MSTWLPSPTELAISSMVTTSWVSQDLFARKHCYLPMTMVNLSKWFITWPWMLQEFSWDGCEWDMSLVWGAILMCGLLLIWLLLPLDSLFPCDFSFLISLSGGSVERLLVYSMLCLCNQSPVVWLVLLFIHPVRKVIVRPYNVRTQNHIVLFLKGSFLLVCIMIWSRTILSITQGLVKVVFLEDNGVGG